MKIAFLLFILASSFAAADGVQSRVSIHPQSIEVLNAGLIHYAFQLFDETAKKDLHDSDLIETHTKILHFITYDSSRQEFNHVHPVFDGKFWSVDLNLSSNGKYFLWAQGQLTDGSDFSAVTKTIVAGGEKEIPVSALGDVRIGKDHSTIFELSNEILKAGKMTMLGFTVSRDDGQEPQMSPYLGAIAHVIAASPDGDELVHVHPMAGKNPNTGMIHATFQTPGDYRMWVQFNDHGELKTIPLSVQVTP